MERGKPAHACQWMCCAVCTHRHPHLFIPDRERGGGGRVSKNEEGEEELKMRWENREKPGDADFFLYFLTLWSVFDGSRDTLLCRQSNVTNQIWHSTAPMLDETFIFFWGEFRWCNRVQHIHNKKKFLFHLIMEIPFLCIYRQRSRSTRRVWRLRRLLFGWPFNKKKSQQRQLLLLTDKHRGPNWNHDWHSSHSNKEQQHAGI